MPALGELSALLKRSGLIRTDMDCHGCREQGLPDKFIATINHDLDGNHEIQCPRCGHIHFRVIKDGVVTSERYKSGYPTHKVTRVDSWQSETVPIVASTASAFLRDRWLNPGR